MKVQVLRSNDLLHRSPKAEAIRWIGTLASVFAFLLPNLKRLSYLTDEGLKTVRNIVYGVGSK